MVPFIRLTLSGPTSVPLRDEGERGETISSPRIWRMRLAIRPKSTHGRNIRFRESLRSSPNLLSYCVIFDSSCPPPRLCSLKRFEAEEEGTGSGVDAEADHYALPVWRSYFAISFSPINSQSDSVACASCSSSGLIRSASSAMSDNS